MVAEATFSELSTLQLRSPRLTLFEGILVPGQGLGSAWGHLYPPAHHLTLLAQPSRRPTASLLPARLSTRFLKVSSNLTGKRLAELCLRFTHPPLQLSSCCDSM